MGKYLTLSLRYSIINNSLLASLKRELPKKAGIAYMKRTYQPKKRQASKVHGFRKRMASAGGRKVIKRRRNKGRAKLSA